MGTNEENIIENFVCLSKVEPEPDLYTGSGSDQKVPAPAPQHWWAGHRCVGLHGGQNALVSDGLLSSFNSTKSIPVLYSKFFKPVYQGPK